MLSNANTNPATTELTLCHVHGEFNGFRHVPCIISEPLERTLLHTTQIDMLEHLEKFIFHFIKMLKQLNKYNAVWLSVPAYHNLILQNKSCKKFLNGKRMR
jgi:hypothetical protein